MSSTLKFKEELIHKKFNSLSSQRAYLAAIFKTSESLHMDKYGINLEFNTDNSTFALKILEMINNCYNINVEMNISNHTDANGAKLSLYSIIIPKEFTKELGEAFGLFEYDGDKLVAFKVGSGIILDSWNDKKAYVIGVMTSLSSLTLPIADIDNPNCYNGGYHYEMQFNDEALANEVSNMIGQFGINMKTVIRGEMTCIYLKNSESISDIAALAGASGTVIQIQNIFVNRSIRNDTNRQNNCAIANIDRTIEASQKQFLAITKIIKTIGLDKLPPKLYELAILRLDNPDYSLEQLGELVVDEVGKSGINHRMRKLMAIADEIDDSEANTNE